MIRYVLALQKSARRGLEPRFAWVRAELATVEIPKVAQSTVTEAVPDGAVGGGGTAPRGRTPARQRRRARRSARILRFYEVQVGLRTRKKAGLPLSTYGHISFPLEEPPRGSPGDTVEQGALDKGSRPDRIGDKASTKRASKERAAAVEKRLEIMLDQELEFRETLFGRPVTIDEVESAPLEEWQLRMAEMDRKVAKSKARLEKLELGTLGLPEVKSVPEAGPSTEMYPSLTGRRHEHYFRWEEPTSVPDQTMVETACLGCGLPEEEGEHGLGICFFV